LGRRVPHTRGPGPGAYPIPSPGACTCPEGAPGVGRAALPAPAPDSDPQHWQHLRGRSDSAVTPPQRQLWPPKAADLGRSHVRHGGREPYSQGPPTPIVMTMPVQCTYPFNLSCPFMPDFDHHPAAYFLLKTGQSSAAEGNAKAPRGRTRPLRVGPRWKRVVDNTSAWLGRPVWFVNFSLPSPLTLRVTAARALRPAAHACVHACVRACFCCAICCSHGCEQCEWHGRPIEHEISATCACVARLCYLSSGAAALTVSFRTAGLDDIGACAATPHAQIRQCNVSAGTPATTAALCCGRSASVLSIA
jgi:hypothetical protein